MNKRKYKTIKVFIFDFDGVLYSGTHKFDNVAPLVNKNRRTFLPYISNASYDKICKENPEWLEHASGASIVEYILGFKEKYKNLKISTRNFVRWQDSIIYDIIIEKVCNPKTIEELCKKYPVYIVSNSPLNHLKYYINKLNLKYSWFKKVYSNRFFDYDFTKEHYYKHILELENEKPENACVIGDSVKNDLDPAEKLNIKTFFINDASKLDNLIEDIIKNY